MNLLDLTDDSIAHICTFLNRVEDLSAFELTCQRIRRVIAHCGCWRLASVAKVPRIGTLLDSLACPHDHDQEHPRSSISKCATDFPLVQGRAATEKYVAKLLSGNGKALLRMWPLCATSYDNNHENLGNVISPIVKSIRGFSYWSSVGTDDENSGESLAFALDTPVCVVKSISVRPFQAWFQDSCPIYGSKKIQLTIGGIPMFKYHKKLNPIQQVDLAATDLGVDGDSVALSKSVLLEMYRKRNEIDRIESRDPSIDAMVEQFNAAGSVGQWDEVTWTWKSPQFDVQNEDELQRFNIPAILCIGGYVRIDLIGRNSRQEIDNKYYTCLGRVCINGYALPGFYGAFSKDGHLTCGFDAAHKQFFSGESPDILGYETLYDNDSSSESEMYTTQHQFVTFLDRLENIPVPNEAEVQESLEQFHRAGVFAFADEIGDAQDDSLVSDDE